MTPHGDEACLDISILCPPLSGVTDLTELTFGVSRSFSNAEINQCGLIFVTTNAENMMSPRRCCKAQDK